MELSTKELQQLDRFLTDVARKRLARQRDAFPDEVDPISGKITKDPRAGMISIAEYRLKQAGILTDDMRSIDTTDRNELIDRTNALGNFARAQTSRLKGFKRHIDLKIIRTKEHGIPLRVQDVIDKLKQKGLWNKVAANYHDSATILELIEQVIEDVEDDREILNDTSEEFWKRFEDEVGISLGELSNPTAPLNMKPKDEFGFGFSMDDLDEEDEDIINKIWRV